MNALTFISAAVAVVIVDSTNLGKAVFISILPALLSSNAHRCSGACSH